MFSTTKRYTKIAALVTGIILAAAPTAPAAAQNNQGSVDLGSIGSITKPGGVVKHANCANWWCLIGLLHDKILRELC